MPFLPSPDLLRALNSSRWEIEHAIARAVDQSFVSAELGTEHKAQEPDFIAYFFLQGLQRLEIELREILRRHDITVTLSGIFCHQTPKVVPQVSANAKTSSCELGDLLLVSLHTPPQGSFEALVSDLLPHAFQNLEHAALGSALLLQSKMHEVTPSLSDLQWQLYSQSKGFDYLSPKKLAGKSRSLQDASAALWYWSLLKEKGNSNHRESLTWNTSAVHARSPWGSKMAERFEWPFHHLVWSLFAGIAGESIYRQDAPTTRQGGWSAIVNDLISNTAHLALKRNNAHIVRSDPNLLRGSEALRALNATSNPSPSLLVRASLGDALSAFSEELEKVGHTLESQSRASIRNPFTATEEKVPQPREGKGGEPPILGRVMEGRDRDGGGMSFIIANWQEL